MLTPQRQITRLLAHLCSKPGDKQARARLYELGYSEPKSTLSCVDFDAMLKQLYKPELVQNISKYNHPLLSMIPKDKPATVWFPKTDEDARKLGYGVAYVVVKTRE